MPKKGNTPYHKWLVTAQQTIDLIDNRQTPDRVSDAISETLIQLSWESRMQIWHKATGLSLETLAALYTLYERGNGYRRSRLSTDAMKLSDWNASTNEIRITGIHKSAL